jgi:ferrochelatase
LKTNKGILLINLGTPDNTDGASVYRYLTQFLNDPRVIDLPAVLRWILTNLIIVPFRFKKSAEAYQQIWTLTGSPLLTNSIKLKNSLALELGDEYQVELAMRYGNPSIAKALHSMQGCEQLMVIPLFPQYSSAATGSALEETILQISKQWNIPDLYCINNFYDNPGFIDAYVNVLKDSLANQSVDHIILSFHGLPERHITKSDCQAHCDHINACPIIDMKNNFCYRAQCYQTAARIAEKLSWRQDQYTVSFQSRLGRTPWIKPYTDLVLPELFQKGIKNIAIVCPSFVADCLETLEEINIRAREDWKKLGGNAFLFVPCINDHSRWVKALADIVLNKMNKVG